jgi:hypothetical protein
MSTCIKYTLKVKVTWSAARMYERESGWYRGNALDLYSGGARFESRSGHRLHQLRFHWFSLVPPGKLRDIISFRSRSVNSKSFQIHQSSYNSMFYIVRSSRAH